MNILVDHQIIKLVQDGELFDPSSFSKEQCKGCFYDLRLASGRFYSDMKQDYMDVSSENPLVIHPQETVSVVTQETLNLRSGRFCGFLFSTVRLLHSGIFKPATTIDPGFNKQLIITFINWGKGNVVLYPGTSITKVCFIELTEKPDRLWVADAWWKSFPKDYPPPLLETNWEPVTHADDEALELIRQSYGSPYDILISRLLSQSQKINELQEQIDSLKDEIRQIRR